MAAFADFEKLDIRVGRIISVEDFLEARNPSHKLNVDVAGDIGVKKPCAQSVSHYAKDDLLGRLVLCVVNFPTKQVGPARSEVLTLGVAGEDG